MIELKTLPFKEAIVARKYLEDANITPVGADCGADDKRQEKWAEERKLYGFDSRDTWSLDYTMVALLFERLECFIEVASQVVDLDYHKFEWEGEEFTQMEAMERLREMCLEYFQADDTFGADSTMTQRIWQLWSVITPAMWW